MKSMFLPTKGFTLLLHCFMNSLFEFLFNHHNHSSVSLILFTNFMYLLHRCLKEIWKLWILDKFLEMDSIERRFWRLDLMINHFGLIWWNPRLYLIVLLPDTWSVWLYINPISLYQCLYFHTMFFRREIWNL